MTRAYVSVLPDCPDFRYDVDAELLPDLGLELLDELELDRVVDENRVRRYASDPVIEELESRDSGSKEATSSRPA